MINREPSSITALLGPTNTGKTHFAIERMLTHASGMIGLPLRLLAREVYDRVRKKVGTHAVALITGEEKQMPLRPRYFICTVEAMPTGREVDFLAVDEVQLAAHIERGHVFTDRLLHWRGRLETYFLGAETMRPLVERLIPTADIQRKHRLSRLSFGGQLSLAALPPRTAVVAFSVNRVYELGERLRARRGGAAVVMGALSPRTRNAQVALFESGEVNYLVATDAIGMGLNLDVDCVAFADLQKFDGRKVRELNDAELAQIAGRAGRYHRHGRFVTLLPRTPLSACTVTAIEEHRFPFLSRMYWRSADLDFSSLVDLQQSLLRKPPHLALELMDDADDQRALSRLANDPEIARRCKQRGELELLWQVCQIPDYRQLQLDDHFKLLRAVFLQISGIRGRLEPDWIRRHLDRLSGLEGDIDTLLARMAFIRTWTNITHHTRWLDDAERFQSEARDMEDRLSDILHERLMQRFVDVASNRRTRGRPASESHGSLGMQLQRYSSLKTDVLNASYEADIAPCTNDDFSIDNRGHILIRGEEIGWLIPGNQRWRPEVKLNSLRLTANHSSQPLLQLRVLVREWAENLLKPLHHRLVDRLDNAGRGIVYQLEQGLGTCDVEAVKEQVHLLSEADRSRLGRMGIHLGRSYIFVRSLLAPPALEQRRLLCCIEMAKSLPVSPSNTVWDLDPEVSDHMYLAMGFGILEDRAVRVDALEYAWPRVQAGIAVRKLARLIGCNEDEARFLVHALRPRRYPTHAKMKRAS